MTEICVPSKPADGPSDGIFLTNRCKDCGRFITKLEVLRAIAGHGNVCPCGGNKFKCTNAKWWEELFLLRSWKLYRAWKRGDLAPNPTKEEVKAPDKAIVEFMKQVEEEDTLEQEIKGFDSESFGVEEQ